MINLNLERAGTIREVPVAPINSYSCQLCGKEFIAPEQKIILCIKPLCSSRCEFKLCYKQLSTYGNTYLKILWEEAYPLTAQPKTRKEALFELTKYVFRRNHNDGFY